MHVVVHQLNNHIDIRFLTFAAVIVTSVIVFDYMYRFYRHFDLGISIMGTGLVVAFEFICSSA